MRTLLTSDNLGLAVCKELNINPQEHMLTSVAFNADCGELVTMNLRFDLTVEQFNRIAGCLNHGDSQNIS